MLLLQPEIFDGLGRLGMGFHFRVVYTSGGNVPPADGYPRLLLDANGDGLLSRRELEFRAGEGTRGRGPKGGKRPNT